MEAPFKPFRVVCIDEKSQVNPYVPTIKMGEIVTVVGQCPVHASGWDILEYPNDFLGRPCSYNKKNFAPIEPTRERIKYVAVSEKVREKPVEVAETLRQTAVEIAAVESN